MLRAALLLTLIAPVPAFGQGVKADPARNVYDDAAFGYMLQAPRFPGLDASKTAVALTLAGLPVDGFAPNINVVNQAIVSNLGEFKAQTLATIEKQKFKLNAQKVGKLDNLDTLEIDYEGEIRLPTGQARKLRFLALSIIDKERVLILTCTDTVDHFPTVEAEFRTAIASFKPKAPAPKP